MSAQVHTDKQTTKPNPDFVAACIHKILYPTQKINKSLHRWNRGDYSKSLNDCGTLKLPP